MFSVYKNRSLTYLTFLLKVSNSEVYMTKVY